jgi:hypothetical protein
MPIRINLLAEAQAAEEARRRDPVKRTMWVAGVLIVIMLGWGGIELSKAMMANSVYQAEEAIWKGLVAQYGEVKTNNMRALDLEKKIDALTDLSTNRFLWGSTLNSLQNCLNTPNPLADQIQLIRVSGNQNFVQISGTPPKKAENRVIAGKPAQSIETVNLVIEGKDYGNPIDQNYLKLRTNLWNVPYVKAKLGSIDSIRLLTVNQQQTPDAEGKLFTTFVLECKFPEKKREER